MAMDRYVDDDTTHVQINQSTNIQQIWKHIFFTAVHAHVLLSSSVAGQDCRCKCLYESDLADGYEPPFVADAPLAAGFTC
jgi:hypothetical protein